MKEEMVIIYEPDFVFEDERGSLIQLIHSEYSQVNFVRSFKGAARGGHYHKENRELFYIIEGNITVDVEKDGAKEQFHFKAGDMFCILPYVVHSFTFHEDTLLIGMYDEGVEHPDGSKDIYNG